MQNWSLKCLVIGAVTLALSASAEASGRRSGLSGNARVTALSGIASVYDYSSQKTANGEHLHPHAFTAAHRTLPFGTMVRVTNRNNGRSVVVRINDRGPFVRGRVIDLTPAAARSIGVSGLAPVQLAVVDRTEHASRD